MYDEIIDLITKTIDMGNMTVDQGAKMQLYLTDLEEDRDLLYALQAAGVDNWYGYEEAMKIYHENQDEKE